MTDRTTARVVGGLFLTATVAGLLGVALEQSVVGATDYLTKAARSEAQVATSALLVMMMGLAVVGIAIAIYPVLRRYSERLALGYVVARSIEAVIYVIGVIALMTLTTLGRAFVDAGSPTGSWYQSVGDVLLAVRDWGGHAVLDAAVFGVSALILNYVLYRTDLVPRWLSLWGLGGAFLYMAAGILVTFGLEPLSTPQILLEAPLGLQELALAIWLIVKGFDTASLARHSLEEPATAPL